MNCAAVCVVDGCTVGLEWKRGGAKREAYVYGEDTAFLTRSSRLVEEPKRLSVVHEEPDLREAWRVDREAIVHLKCKELCQFRWRYNVRVTERDVRSVRQTQNHHP